MKWIMYTGRITVYGPNEKKLDFTQVTKTKKQKENVLYDCNKKEGWGIWWEL